MNPGNQDEPTRYMGAPQGRGGYEGGYQNQGGYEQYQYADYGSGAPAERQGPSIDYVRLVGSILATALVAAIAGALASFIVYELFDRFGHVWSSGGNTPTMFAVYGALAAIVAGVLWYLLSVATPDPGTFFGWIVALLIIAAVALPLIVTTELLDGIAAAVVHLFIGLPILALTGTFARTWKQ